MDTELHREVCHRRTVLIRLHVHVRAEVIINLLYVLHDSLVLHDFLLTLVRETVKKHYRVVRNLFVEILIKATPHFTCIIVPYPPHIVSKLIEAL